ncbi:hypothetical protein [Maribacter sp. IgM3_T14_3]|uniref:hypothetical protein n=1 Tax=Maribacter sp. IgM3_T14_3 TaxID=3415140 RepID=UPI003C6F7698
MRNSRLVVATIALLWNFQGNAQSCMTMLKDQLVAELNEKVAPAFQLTIEKDTGAVQLLKLKQRMPLNRSPKKGSFFESLSKKPGPYRGPIYWIYDFEKIGTSSVTFKQDTTSSVLLEIQFKTPDSVLINAKKNAYSSVHRTIDVQLHQVIWSGEKTICIDLKIVKEMNQIFLEVEHVAIQGILKRADTFEIAKNFRPNLEEALKKGFLPAFQNPEFVTTLNEILLGQH